MKTTNLFALLSLKYFQRRLIIGVSLMTLVLLILLKPCKGIDVYSKNPFYWEQNGKPVLLLGASGDDNLFQWAGDVFGSRLAVHLDLLKSVGGNYVRNTMSSRYDACNKYNDDYMAYPFKKLPSGKYDLNECLYNGDAQQYWCIKDEQKKDYN